MNAIHLDEDWDPEKYDAAMETVFNNSYYDENEDEEKPDVHLEELFDEDELPEELKEEMKKREEEGKEDEALLGSDEGDKGGEGDEGGEGGGEGEGDENEGEGEGDENEGEGEGDENEGEGEGDENDNDNEEGEGEHDNDKDEDIKKAKEEANKLMDELYSLDYEDMIGDTPVRFHYTRVKPASYGLSTEDILNATDKELRQYVSIKKLAPYRDHEWRIGKGTAGKFKALLNKRMKREAKEEKLSRKQEKKQRKKEQKIAMKRMEEEEKK